MVSSPTKSKAFTGLRKLTFLTDTTISLSHIYSTAASLASSPNSCPITSSGLYCGNDIYTYLVDIHKASSGSNLENHPDLGKDYQNQRILTRGTGDTSNTTFVMSLQVFDAETGDNVTTAYHNWLGYSNFEFRYNATFDNSGNVTGGKTVGTMKIMLVLFSNGNLLPPINSSTVADGTYSQSALNGLNAISSGRTKFIFKTTFVSLDTN